MLKKLLRFFRGSYTSAGIDISDGNIRYVNLKLQRGKEPVLIEFIQEPLPEHAVDDGKIKDQLLVLKSVQTLVNRLDVKPDYAHFVLPSQLIMVRFLKLPDTSAADTRRMVEFELKHNIHLPFINPTFDFVKVNGKSDYSGLGLGWFQSLLSPLFGNHRPNTKAENKADLHAIESSASEGPQTPMCDVMLVATSKDYVEAYTELLEQSKLPVQTIEIKALSLLRYIEVCKIVDPKSTFLVVDINSITTDLTIYHDGFVGITRNVPINFFETESPMTEDTDNEALRMAMQIARDAQFQTLCNDLAYEVERLMSFYRYSLNHQQFERFDHILLTGEMKRLKEASNNLTRALSAELKLLTPQNLGESEKIRSVFSSFSIALGTALRGNEG